jgi:hypothetical protein
MQSEYNANIQGTTERKPRIPRGPSWRVWREAAAGHSAGKNQAATNQPSGPTRRGQRGTQRAPSSGDGSSAVDIHGGAHRCAARVTGYSCGAPAWRGWLGATWASTVVAQQGNYRASGFRTAWNTIRFEGTPSADTALPSGVVLVDARSLPFDRLAAYDRH